MNEAEARSSPRVARCMVCGHVGMSPLARRGDGAMVLRCDECGMGVLDRIPDDLMALYGDDYYGTGGEGGRADAGQGYEDYAYTAEHGVAWAAALVRLLRPAGGRVLDIGCADGHLLAKLGPGYELHGIEANAAAGRSAAGRGVSVLGRDLLDPALVAAHAGRFDVVTAVAVFEHLRDIRAGVEAALRLLKRDGVLVFEVPLMSARHDNRTWLTTSLEHVWYPSEDGLRRLVETELGARLVGAEVHVRGYASTFVGLVSKEVGEASRIRAVAARVLTWREEPASAEEWVARMLLRLVHAATATHDDIGVLAEFPPEALNRPLLRRLAELWQADLWRLGAARAEAQRARAEADQEAARARRLEADLAAAVSDRRLNQAELACGIAAMEERLRAAEAASAAAEQDLAGRRASLEAWRDALEAERSALEAHSASLEADAASLEAHWASLEEERAAVRRLQDSTAWRVTMRMQGMARRHPVLARQAVRAARLVWWTLRGTLLARLRARRAAATDAAPPPLAAAPPRRVPRLTRVPPPAPTPSPAPAPAPTPVPGPAALRLLDETGHRPALLGGEPDPWPDDRPLVSVVVPCFNYGRFVAQAVDSVLAQTFRDLEVIVVEGGSPDRESRRLVAELDRPRTRVLLQGEGRRVGANRNLGISQARGRYICCLDADDLLRPTYIEKAVFLLERHGYDVVSCALETFGDRSEVAQLPERPDLEALLEANQVMTCAVFRRALWERAGGFRDADRAVTGHVHEDWAFWVRLAALGARFINLPRDPQLLYRTHGASLSVGADVLPMARQRALVREMNADLIDDGALARSRRRAAQRPGTPPVPLPELRLDRTVGPGDGRPTLLLAMPFLVLGGAERLLSAVVAHLTASGWRVVVVTSVAAGAGHGDTTPWFEAHTPEIFHLPRFLPRDLWDDFLRHLVATRRVDILWVVGSAHAYGRLRALRAEFPRLRVADLLFNTVGHTADNRRRRDLIDLIFVENEEVRRWLLERGEAPGRIRLVESGVDLERLRPAPRSAELVRRIGAAPGDAIVGFAGRWSEEKDPLAFVEMARRVDSSLPVRFVMAGTGHLRPHIERAVADAGFPEGRFHLLGDVPDIAPVLASLDLLVVPSRLDGRPVVALEALALGVPVLASRIGALPDLVEEGETGWLCEPGDVEAFARRVEGAVAAREELARMCPRARAFAEAHLDARAMLAAYHDALRSLLPDHHPAEDGPAMPVAEPGGEGRGASPG